MLGKKGFHGWALRDSACVEGSRSGRNRLSGKHSRFDCLSWNNWLIWRWLTSYLDKAFQFSSQSRQFGDCRIGLSLFTSYVSLVEVLLSRVMVATMKIAGTLSVAMDSQLQLSVRWDSRDRGVSFALRVPYLKLFTTRIKSNAHNSIFSRNGLYLTFSPSIAVCT